MNDRAELDPPHPPERPDWKRPLFFAAGWLFVALAALGLFLPLLPTTPFLLLAGSCFLRSSPRARHWLYRSRWFGPALRDWDEHRAVRRSVKILAVAVVSTMLVLTFLRDLSWLVRGLVVAVAAVGLMVLWRLPTVPRQTPTDQAATVNRQPPAG